jgi:hypothetical protein
MLRFRLLVMVMLLAACSPGATPGPTILPGPSGAVFSAAELRLLLIDRFGPRWYCDPDEYPVSHGTEQERAIERFEEMRAEGDIYGAVAARLGIDGSGALTDAQKVAIYHVWKVALSIPLDPVGESRYRFEYTAQPVGGAATGTRTAGLIDQTGAITIEQQSPAGEPNCPICLSLGTRIATPRGPIAVEQLRIGDPIWTLDADGRPVAGTVIALGSTQAPADHHVLRLGLADGRSVTASPGHPLLDGRLLGDLHVGDVVDGSRITSLDLLPYSSGETFDLVASGPTGAYLAGGIALGTTLR